MKTRRASWSRNSGRDQGELPKKRNPTAAAKRGKASSAPKATAAKRGKASKTAVGPRKPATVAAASARQSRGSGNATRERILRTAQRLFGQHGIDAVSLNVIIGAAKVNAAAIHYHFGSKDGLVEEILRRGASQLGERRELILDELEARGSITLRDLVRAMVEPVMELKSTPGGLDYARFLASVSLHRQYSTYLAEVTEPYTKRFFRLVEKVLPELPHDVLIRRFGYARTFVYDAIVVDDRSVELWMQIHGLDDDPSAASRDLIDLLAGGLGSRVSK